MQSPRASLLLATLLWGAGCSVLAQTNAPATPATPSSPTPPMHQRGPMGPMDRAAMEARHAKHLAELKTKLKITPVQEGAWTAFAAAMKPPAPPAERPDPAALDKLPLPERIDQMRAFRAKHQAERQSQMEQYENAAKTFYASLNPDQKKTMDAEHSRMQRGLHRMHERHARSDARAPMPPAAPATPAR